MNTEIVQIQFPIWAEVVGFLVLAWCLYVAVSMKRGENSMRVAIVLCLSVATFSVGVANVVFQVQAAWNNAPKIISHHALVVSNIDEQNGVIYVKGKRGELETVRVSPSEVRKEYKAYPREGFMSRYVNHDVTYWHWDGDDRTAGWLEINRIG